MKKKFMITVTEGQEAAQKRLLAQTLDGDQSKMIRRLLAQECARYGIEYPQDMPAPGPKAQN